MPGRDVWPSLCTPRAGRYSPTRRECERNLRCEPGQRRGHSPLPSEQHLTQDARWRCPVQSNARRVVSNYSIIHNSSILVSPTLICPVCLTLSSPDCGGGSVLYTVQYSVFASSSRCVSGTSSIQRSQRTSHARSVALNGCRLRSPWTARLACPVRFGPLTSDCRAAHCTQRERPLIPLALMESARHQQARH